MKPLIKIEDLKVDFQRGASRIFAVRGVSLELYPGEILGIVGESGSGKSVTASCLLNLIPDNGRITGKVSFRDRDILSLQKDQLTAFRGKRIAMIFQEPGRSFDPIYNLEKTFQETLLAHFPDLSSTEIRNRSIELLTEVGLPQPEDRLSNFPHQFSGGQLQRIMIALALACEPEVLIADEPTTALDVTIQAGIIKLLKELRNKRELSIIFITHDIDLVAQMADRITVMYAGLIMESGPAETLYRSPGHPYSRALMDSVPRFGAHYSNRKLKTIGGKIPDPRYPEPGCPFAPRCPKSEERCLETIPPFKEEITRQRCIFSREEIHG